MAASPNADLQWQRCGPSDALATIFRASSVVPEEVQSNLDHLLNRFMKNCSATADERKLVRLQNCCYECKMWYYKILEGLLQENTQRSGFKNVSNFLEDKPLQCCLVVCCLVITSYTNELAFGFDLHLLQIFSLAPYNFWKVLLLVLQTKVDLTLYVTEHLLAVEEVIVESLVWATDSPIWEEIRENGGQMPACQQVMHPKELEDPMRRKQSDQDTIQVDIVSDQQNSTLERLQRNSSLKVFVRKIYRLMHKRLTTLCSSLLLQEELHMKIWTCFEYSLVHHFDMLQDRQLDWLLLCATHELTKDSKELSFKHIFNCYRSKHRSKNLLAPRRCPEKSHSDYSHGGRLPTPNTPSVHDHEDEVIVCFYSQVYNPVMGHFVKKFAPAPGAETPPLSPYPTPPTGSTRKHRLRPGSNFFVSQLNKETIPQQQPAGMDYVFQSSPPQRLIEINTVVSSRLSNSKRELALTPREDADDEEAGTSAKMPHMQSGLLRRLQDVEHDRRQSRAQDKAGPSSRHLYI